PAEPPKPEDEVALAAFAALEKSGVLAKGDFKKHYFRVSEILKTYVGARYGFDAPESTTQEMLQMLDRAMAAEFATDATKLGSLIELFGQLDLVKFTDHVPAGSDSSRVVAIAREFVLG